MVQHNNKAVFFITVSIPPEAVAPSKRGPLRPVEITHAELIRVMDAPPGEEE